jgi:hypothetical protein
MRDPAHEGDGEGVAGELVDLEADRDDGELGADPRDGSAEPEAGESRRLAQR